MHCPERILARRDLRSRPWSRPRETWILPGILASLPDFCKQRTGLSAPIRSWHSSWDPLIDTNALSEDVRGGSRSGVEGLYPCAGTQSFSFIFVWIFYVLSFLVFGFLTGSFAAVVIFNIHLFTVNTNGDTVQLISLLIKIFDQMKQFFNS